MIQAKKAYSAYSRKMATHILRLKRRCCINKKYSLIINELLFSPDNLKFFLINHVLIFVQQRRLKQ